jgi:hypothetical protein
MAARLRSFSPTALLKLKTGRSRHVQVIGRQVDRRLHEDTEITNSQANTI